MYRSTFLSPSHYAGKWIIPDQDQKNDLQAVNLLGYAYATSPDGPAKEAKLLLVLEKFHGYLMKYLCMIVRGTIPTAGTRAGQDSLAFLRFLARKGVTPSKVLTDATCKSLHLAFKQQSTEEIYDTLAFCFMAAARKYDPYYADKTRTVCEVIGELQEQEFTSVELEARVGFDCLGFAALWLKEAFWPASSPRRRSWDTGRASIDRRPRASFSQALSDLCICFNCGFVATSKSTFRSSSPQFEIKAYLMIPTRSRYEKPGS